jgi:photosystem II stability/assembly factor-like uncharacterized protein
VRTEQTKRPAAPSTRPLRGPRGPLVAAVARGALCATAARGVLVAAVAILACGLSAAPAAQASLLSAPLSNWLWSTPTPQGNSLNKVSFIGEDGYVVGEEGTVLRSLDGGRSWESVRSGTEESLGLLQEIDPATAIVAGVCTLQESIDAGTSFLRMKLPGPENCASHVTDFSFLTADTGFVETNKGAILWTEDAGATFETRTPLPLEGGEPSALRFISPSTGVAIVNGKVSTEILRTEDGGRSWTAVKEIGPALAALTFATPLIGYAVGDKDTLLRTADAGRTWKAMPLTLPPGTAQSYLDSISCSSPETCLMTGTSHGVLRTGNGGMTGTPVPVFAKGRVFDGAVVGGVAFAAPLHAVAVGGAGATALSDDEGATFAEQISHDTEFRNFFETVRIRLGVSPREAFIPSEDGQIVATSDAGEQWRTLQLPTKKDIVDVAFPRPSVGFAVVNNGTVYRTRDSGQTWKRCGPQGHAGATLLAPSSEIVIATGRHGIWRSSDGCASFHHLDEELRIGHRERALSSLNLYSNAGEEAGRALIALGNQILESTDAGAHWKLIPSPPRSGPIYSVSFLGPNVGYAMAAGRLYFTRDAGRRWQARRLSLPLNESGEPSFISFSSVNDGFAATSYPDEEEGATIFRTEDGGRNWTPEALPLGIGAVTARGKIAYAAQKGGGEVFVAKGSGIAGARSRIALAIGGPATRAATSLARAGGEITVHGRLTPALANVTVHVSWHSGEEWQSEATRTDAHGAFSARVQEVEQTITFLADWNGNGTYRGTGTEPIRLTVLRR